jgi:AcrR family transcriptional regulator
MHSSPRTSSTTPTRQRLLDAAALVFARDGLAGSTTRAIAAEAGVNEVTLFRHFQTKDRLLTAVVGQNFGAGQTAASTPLPAPTYDLHADLLALARHYDKVLAENLPLVRTMLGEIHHHHREQEKQVFRGIFRPLKNAMVLRLESARVAGELNPTFTPVLLADLLTAMLFTGSLRCASKDLKLEYSQNHYLESAVELVLRGATVTPEGRRA